MTSVNNTIVIKQSIMTCGDNKIVILMLSFMTSAYDLIVIKQYFSIQISEIITLLYNKCQFREGGMFGENYNIKIIQREYKYF